VQRQTEVLQHDIKILKSYLIEIAGRVLMLHAADVQPTL